MYKSTLAIVVAAIAFAVPANADTNNGPNNPSPGVLYPQAGSKICANHAMSPIPRAGQIYKAACAVGTWGAPAVPKQED